MEERGRHRVLLVGCRPEPEALRSALASPDPAERERAAETLRAIYARDPAALGDHGEAYWKERTAKAQGLKMDDAARVLDNARIGGGGETSTAFRDDFWKTTLGRSTLRRRLGLPREPTGAMGRFRRGLRARRFSGAWTTYYVNGAVHRIVDLDHGVRRRERRFYDGGQVWVDLPLTDGKPDGVETTRAPDGKLEREDTWSSGVERSERTSYSSGKLKLEATYENGKVVRERRMVFTGDEASCEVFDDGVAQPCPP